MVHVSLLGFSMLNLKRNILPERVLKNFHPMQQKTDQEALAFVFWWNFCAGVMKLPILGGIKLDTHAAGDFEGFPFSEIRALFGSNTPVLLRFLKSFLRTSKAGVSRFAVEVSRWASLFLLCLGCRCCTGPYGRLGGEGAEVWGKRPSFSSWWFQIFIIFTPTWGRFPIWLIFFKGVELKPPTSHLVPFFWWGVSWLFRFFTATFFFWFFVTKSVSFQNG